MTKTLTETYDVVGELVTHFGKFLLLRDAPNIHSVPFLLRENGFVEWYVVDQDGFATNILLRGDALVKPYYDPVKMEVKLKIEDPNP